MVIYKRIVTPKAVTSNVNMDAYVDLTTADYCLIDEFGLEQRSSAVVLRTIRFIIAYPSQGPHAMVYHVYHPYQVHLRWLDSSRVAYQPGKVVQNSYIADVDTEHIVVERNMSTDTPAYSTFCEFTTAVNLTEKTGGSEYNHGVVTMIPYELKRDAVIKTGAFSSLAFELYFTNLRGQRFYSPLPAVEVEFEIF